MKQKFDIKWCKIDLINNAFTTGLIADYFKTLYNCKFIYSREILYIYNGVYWKADDKKYSSLQKFIDDEFYKVLVSYGNEKLRVCNDRLGKTMIQPEIDTLKTEIDKVGDFLKRLVSLRNAKERQWYVKDICYKLTDNDLEFDKNPFLFAFENKIYDLEASEFKEPEPEDYISITCEYDYDENYNLTRVETIQTILAEIHPDPILREFDLETKATGLCGLSQESLFICTGSGGNGKSLENSLMLETIGGYGYKLPSSIISQPLKTGANPEIANIHKKRYCLAQEPDKRVCTATMKEITGDSKLNARQLYSGNCQVELCMTMEIETNDILEFDTIDPAVVRRLVVKPFDSRALKKEDYDKQEDKTNLTVMNPLYKTRKFQEEHRQALFIILAEYFKLFKDRGYKVRAMPEKCSKKTNEYMVASDNIFPWFKEHYEKTGGVEILGVDEVYDRFKSSDLFNNMTKKDKRRFNKSGFIEDVEKNVFLRNFVKRRDQSVGKIQLKKTSIIGWVEKPEEEESNEQL